LYDDLQVSKLQVAKPAETADHLRAVSVPERRWTARVAAPRLDTYLLSLIEARPFSLLMEESLP